MSLDCVSSLIKADFSRIKFQTTPGETGWTPDMQAEVSALFFAKSPLYSAMRRILVDLQNDSAAWAFLHPVKAEDVPDYYNVIKNPMGKCAPFQPFQSLSYQLIYF